MLGFICVIIRTPPQTDQHAVNSARPTGKSQARIALENTATPHREALEPRPKTRPLLQRSREASAPLWTGGGG